MKKKNSKFLRYTIRTVISSINQNKPVIRKQTKKKIDTVKHKIWKESVRRSAGTPNDLYFQVVGCKKLYKNLFKKNI